VPLFSFVCLFGAGVTAVLFLGIKRRVDFFADWTFLFHFIPPFGGLIRVRVLKLFVKNRRQTNCIGVRWSLQSGADLFTYIKLP
jgi:hypothetical protein